MSAAPRWWVPELCLILGIPLATVLGGLLTLFVARQDLSDEGARADVKRTGQVQTADLSPDLAAARAGMSARLQVDRARGEVRVSLPPGVLAPAGIELDFVHSLHAGNDLHARLQPRDGAWVGRLAPDAGSRWRVVLGDSQRRWRLVGTLPRGSASLSLQPALASR